MKALFLICSFLLFCVLGFGQKRINTPKDAMDKFEQFRAKEKFLEDSLSYYPGIADSSMRPILSEKINLVANEFERLAKTNNASDKDYQNKIDIGLRRFNEVYLDLDTEDRERVCHYFEELMDIVGLKSSGGLLNNFMYGFDPTEKQ